MATRALAGDLRRYLDERRASRPFVRIDQDAWGVAAGVILQLQKAGIVVAVEDDCLPMFTPLFARDGLEPMARSIAGKAQPVRLLDVDGDQVVASREPYYVHRERVRVSR